MKTKAQGFTATLEPFKKKKVIWLQPYFYQGGKWYKIQSLANRRKKNV